MTNLTLSIDDKLLQAARVRAVQEGTSVNEICRKAIEAYARASGTQRLERYRILQAQIDAMPRSTPLARLLAELANATNRPELLMVASRLSPFPHVPSLATLRRVVVRRTLSRTNTSKP